MRWLTIAEAAQYMHTRKENVMRDVYSGELPAYRRKGAAKYALISTEDIDAHIRKDYEQVMSEGARLRRSA